MPKSNPKVPRPKNKLIVQDYEQQIGELTASLQKLQAEFENYKKRQVAERAELMNSAKVAVLHELLPALDNFDRAATHLPAELENNAWAKGMQYVGQQLLDILEDMGVKRYESAGQAFDHHRHEALEYVEDTGPPDMVVEELTPGYEISGRVVRPATVKVSKPAQAEPKKSEN